MIPRIEQPICAMVEGMSGKVWAGTKAFVRERLGMRTREDLRLHVHMLVPYAVAALVTLHMLDHDRGELVAAFVLSLLSPALALANTSCGFRKWIYGLLPATQALIVGFGWFTDNQVTPIVGAIVAVLGGHLAIGNTPASNGPNDSAQTRDDGPYDDDTTDVLYDDDLDTVVIPTTTPYYPMPLDGPYGRHAL